MSISQALRLTGNKSAVLFLVLLCAISGCNEVVYSLNSIHNDKNTVFSDTLLGDWEDTQGSDKSVISVQKGDDDAYTVKVKDEKGTVTGTFKAYLLNIGDHEFLELSIDHKAKTKSSLTLNGKNIARTWVVVRLTRLNDKVQLWGFGGDVEVKPKAEDAVLSSGEKQPVTSVSSKELEAFYKEHAESMELKLLDLATLNAG